MMKRSAVTLNYLLRRIPPDDWDCLKARAEEQGITIRGILLLLVRAYVDGRVRILATDKDQLDR